MDFILRYSDSEEQILNHVTSYISIVLKETNLIISDSIETDSPVKSEIMRVVSLSTKEITKITRFEKMIFRA